MNGEEFIRSHLAKSIRSQHDMATKFCNKIIDGVVDDFKKNHFNDLDELVGAASKKIRDKTWLISVLSKDGGVTASEFAELAGVCVATARKKLNSTDIASRCCEGRPYKYTLVE